MPFHHKKRPDARMRRLTPQQMDTAFAHCQTVTVREGVQWLKQQFNLTIGKSALAAWLQEQRIERSMAPELSAIRDNQQAASLINDAAPASTPLTVANSVFFASAVFDEFRKPEGERDENRLLRYMDLALRARDLEIRANALQVSLDRLRFHSARNLSDPTLDPESIAEEREKTEEAMLLLFGEPLPPS